MTKYYVNNQEIAFEELDEVLTECKEQRLTLELVDTFSDAEDNDHLYFETNTYNEYY